MDGHVCEELLGLVKHAREPEALDALDVFVKIHYCICMRVDDSPISSDNLRVLNNLFAQKCISAYGAARGNQAGELSTAWVVALYRYKYHSDSYLTVLPLLAAAHILDDLPIVLNKVNIDKPEFDFAFTHIEQCLEEFRVSLKISADLWNSLCGRLLSIFYPLTAATLHELRDLAWQLACMRKDLNSIKF